MSSLAGSGFLGPSFIAHADHVTRRSNVGRLRHGGDGRLLSRRTAHLSHTLTIDDLVLVERAQGGDERAFAALYRRHVRYVAGVLQRLVRRDADEELDDMLQQTFVDAYLGLPRLKNPLGFRPWIARIAARCAYDRLASRKRLQWLAQGFEWTIPRKSDPTDREAIDALYEALDGL